MLRSVFAAGSRIVTARARSGAGRPPSCSTGPCSRSTRTRSRSITKSHAGAPATNAAATLLRSYPEPHPPAPGALACATRANPDQIAGLTLASVARVDTSFTSGHRIKPPFRPLLAAQTLARRAAGADGAEPLFLAPDNAPPVTPRHVRNWLARIGRETGLRFDATSGWERYTTPAWATFHQLGAGPLARSSRAERPAQGSTW
jgi:hypothetical protein